jgi:uncharacterized membrane protein
MSEKRNKYDTDPLDPDFVRQTEEFRSGGRETASTPNEQARLNPDADAPTRRIDDPLSQSYPSIFVPPAQSPPPPPAYQQPTYQQPTYQQPAYRQSTYQQSTAANLGHTAPMAGVPQRPAPPTSRPVGGLGIPENVAVVLPYVPFYIGIVGAVIELLLVPRRETRVRFHAAQGLALQLAMLAISLMLGFIGSIAGSRMGGSLFWFASFIFLIVSIIRVWKGETHHIAPLDEATSWLYERVEPRK